MKISSDVDLKKKKKKSFVLEDVTLKLNMYISNISEAICAVFSMRSFVCVCVHARNYVKK